jgi:hypothetical protein
MFIVKKIRRAKKSEIDAIVNISKKMTPNEFHKYMQKRFSEDFLVFKRLIKEQKKGFQRIKNQPPIKPLLEKVESFYNDLILDGHIKKDFSLFESDKLEEWKWSQSRDEAISLLRELEETKHKDYQEVFRKWNRVHANQYETLCNEYLVKPAQKILGKRIRNKARVLKTLSSYKEGKYAELFGNLIPQIRNSIQHQDFLIDPKQPKITFYDRNKPPLTLTLEEYSEILWEPFFLTLAFDIAWFDLRSGIIEILIEAIDTVDEFFKKRGDKLMPDEFGLSILDWALLIKTGKIRI